MLRAEWNVASVVWFGWTGYWILETEDADFVEFLMKGKTKINNCGKSFCLLLWWCMIVVDVAYRYLNAGKRENLMYASRIMQHTHTHTKYVKMKKPNRNKDHLKVILVSFFIHSSVKMRCTECNEWLCLQQIQRIYYLFKNSNAYPFTMMLAFFVCSVVNEMFVAQN